VVAHRAPEYIVECLWPGVVASDLRALDQRAASTVAALARDGETVRYLGSLLMPEDEVVLCSFEGSPDTVRRTAHRAEIPFDRILEAARSPWDP
jgi:hypothetical protein